jgi:hypothetical protein
MAINLITDQPEGFQIDINNGDLKALSEIVNKWRFKDKESALRFAIAVLSLTEEGTLCQEKKDGSVVKFMPTENMLIQN